MHAYIRDQHVDKKLRGCRAQVSLQSGCKQPAATLTHAQRQEARVIHMTHNEDLFLKSCVSLICLGETWTSDPCGVS